MLIITDRNVDPTVQALLGGNLALGACGLHLGALFLMPYEEIFDWAMFFFGTTFGGISGGLLVNYIGRKLSLAIAGVCIIITGICFVVPESEAIIIIGRTIIGFAYGIIYVVQIILVGEVSLPNNRGTFTSFIHFFICLGWLVQSLSLKLEPADAQLGLGIFTIILGCLSVGNILFSKESPYYLILNGKDDSAKNSLSKLRGDGIDIYEEFLEIKSRLFSENAQQRRSTFSELFKKNKKGFLLALIVTLINISTFNIPFITMHYSMLINILPDNPTWLLTILSVSRLIGCIIILFFVDKIGRKRFLIVSGLGGAICLIIVSVVIRTSTTFETIYVAFAFTLIFELLMGLGFGTIVDIIANECFTNPVKPLGISILTIISGLVCILHFHIVHLISKNSEDVLFWSLYMTTAAILIIGSIIVYIYLPETKQKSMKELKECYIGKNISEIAYI